MMLTSLSNLYGKQIVREVQLRGICKSLSLFIMCLYFIIPNAFEAQEINFGDNLLAQSLPCSTTKTVTFQGKENDTIVINVTEVQDFGGGCGDGGSTIACLCFDQCVELKDEDNNSIAKECTGIEWNHNNRFRTILLETLPSDGTYKISVRDAGKNALGGRGHGRYSLFLQNINQPGNAQQIMPGDELNFALKSGEVDTFTFDAINGDNVLIQMAAAEGSAIRPVIELFDRSGNTIAAPQGGTINKKLNSSGTFTLLARSRVDRKGAYKLALKSVTNEKPVAISQEVEVVEDTEIEIVLMGDDGDEELDQGLSYVLTSIPTLGTLSESIGGLPIANDKLPLTLLDSTLYFTPLPNQIEQQSFNFQVLDDGGTNNEGIDTSGEATVTIDILPVNDPPVIENIEGTPLIYIENDSPKIITTSLMIIDVDSSHLENAEVAITSNFIPEEDKISISNQAGIKATYMKPQGILYLENVGNQALVSDFETAFQSITYHNNSDTPSTEPRLISFLVRDSDNESNLVSREITIVENDSSDDIDGDSLNDIWELEHFGGLQFGGDDNPDGDDFTNIEEFENNSDPFGYRLEISIGWNLIFIYKAPEDNRINRFFDEKSIISVWSYNNEIKKYEMSNTLESSKGYWIYSRENFLNENAIIIELP